MRRITVKRFICSTLSVIMCLGAASCGQKETKVEDYGVVTEEGETVSQEETGSAGDAEFEQGLGSTLKEFYGDRVTWEDEFTVNGVPFKINTYFDIPDASSMSVYTAKFPEDDAKTEEAMVKSIFGDTAKKLEEIKPINEYDYLPMMYKYREIMTFHEWADPDPEVPVISFTIDHTILKKDTQEEFKWLDDNNIYIHMYEGEYNGVRFGLLLAYDYFINSKYVFFEPVSIKEYFPNCDYKSLVVTSGDVENLPEGTGENKCTESFTNVTSELYTTLKDQFKLGDNITLTNDTEVFIRNNRDNLADYQSYAISNLYGDPGPSQVLFSDADYISTIKKATGRGTGVDYAILADQTDLYTNYTADHEMDIYSFLSSTSPAANEGVVDPTYTWDGYAVYFHSDFMTLNDSMDFAAISGNVGIVKYTSKGLYSIDALIMNDITGVTEDVKLLDFEKVKESIKSELEDPDTGFDAERLQVSSVRPLEKVTFQNMALTYYAHVDENWKKGDEFKIVPVWSFFFVADSYASKVGMLYVNAMDGTIENIEYWSFEEQ